VHPLPAHSASDLTRQFGGGRVLFDQCRVADPVVPSHLGDDQLAIALDDQQPLAAGGEIGPQAADQVLVFGEVDRVPGAGGWAP
jgi:hypothetical protein